MEAESTLKIAKCTLNSEESTSEEARCMLSRLPKEVRWMVLNRATESIGAIRLVSKAWLTMVEEWAIQPNLPELQSIEMEQASPESIRIILQIRKSEAACFQLLRVILHGYEITKRQYRDATDICFIFAYDSPVMDRLDAVLGRRTEALKIRGRANATIEPSFENAIRKVTKDLNRVTNLTLPLVDNDSLKMLLEIGNNFLIQQLLINVFVRNLFLLQTTLLEFCTKVDAIQIKLSSEEPIEMPDSVKNENWVALMLAIFDRTNSVDIISHYVDGVYRVEDVRRILDILFSRGNLFHFRTILHENPGAIIVRGCRKRVIKTGLKWILDVSSRPPPRNAYPIC